MKERKQDRKGGKEGGKEGKRVREREILANCAWQKFPEGRKCLMLEALPLIDLCKVWDVMKELLTGALLVCCDDVCIICYSFPHKLYNNI